MTVKNNSKPNTSSFEPKLTSTADFQNLMLSSLIHLKHEMNSLMYTVRSNYENILKLMNDNELRALENKIKDTEFRISLLVGNKDFGNSVHIMMRLFSDQFLVNYSLYRFKKKKNVFCQFILLSLNHRRLLQHYRQEVHR
ncbi:DUF4806 domain-containing protein, partial [Aphis craccivora]